MADELTSANRSIRPWFGATLSLWRMRTTIYGRFNWKSGRRAYSSSLHLRHCRSESYSIASNAIEYLKRFGLPDFYGVPTRRLEATGSLSSTGKPVSSSNSKRIKHEPSGCCVNTVGPLDAVNGISSHLGKASLDPETKSDTRKLSNALGKSSYVADWFRLFSFVQSHNWFFILACRVSSEHPEAIIFAYQTSDSRNKDVLTLISRVVRIDLRLRPDKAFRHGQANQLSKGRANGR